MKTFHYMTSSSIGIKTVQASSFFAVWMAEKAWFGPNAAFVIWDENDDIRIFHG